MSSSRSINLYIAQGRYEEAEPLCKRALAIQEKVLGPDNPFVALSLDTLGNLYAIQGRFGDAEALLKRALGIQEKALGPDYLEVASSLTHLVQLYLQQGRYEEAEPLCKRALAIQEKVLGPDNPLVALSLDNLGSLYTVKGRFGDAEALYSRAVGILEKALGPDRLEIVDSLHRLAELYMSQGRYEEAEPLCKRALAIQEKAFGPDDPGVASMSSDLATLYRVQGRHGDAESLYRRALVIRENHPVGLGNRSVATSLTDLAELYYAWAQPAQALPLFDQGFQILEKQFEYYFTFMSETERLKFLGTVRHRFSEYFSFCFTYRRQVRELAGNMYDTVLWQKGFIVQSVAALRAKIQASGDPEALRLLDRLTEKKSQLAKLVSASGEANE